MPSPRGETLFAWSIFPLAIFGSLGLAIFLLNDGASPFVALGVPGFLGYLVVVAGERLYPHVPDWNRNHGDVTTDAAWAASIVGSGQLLVSGAGFVALGLGS